MAQLVELWTCDEVIEGSTSNRAPLCSNTPVPLSPSSIIWYWPKGGDALWLEGNVGLTET